MLSAATNFDVDYGKPAFSPDERFLAYISESDSERSLPQILHVAGTSTGKELAAFDVKDPVGWMGWVP